MRSIFLFLEFYKVDFSLATGCQKLEKVQRKNVLRLKLKQLVSILIKENKRHVHDSSS